jgi:putative NIF3 family GTP cyclohydrolase 1 type 2
MTLASLADRVHAALGGPAPRIAGARERAVARVAVAPGAGSDLVAEAAASGADVLVTGDVSHHRAREALDRGLCLVDPGHVATERPGLVRLLAWVREIAPGTVDLLDLDPDPFAS